VKSFIFSLIVVCTIISGCANHSVIKALSQEKNYTFRKVRWGMTQEQVELSEVGNTVVWRTEREVIYKAWIDNVPCKVIYTFKDNRLRTAGYITNIPVKNADNLFDKSYEEHGEPTYVDKGSTWIQPKTVIYSNLYKSYVKPTSARTLFCGNLSYVINDKTMTQFAGAISRWDATYTYIDRQFYNDLLELERSELEISFYEQKLLGITRRPFIVDLRYIFR
jgi:hypothetical protein